MVIYVLFVSVSCCSGGNVHDVDVLMKFLIVTVFFCFFFVMIRRPPRSTLDRSSAASDVYKRQAVGGSILKL